MTMVAKDSARRLYSRKQYGLLCLFDGLYFGPKGSKGIDGTKLTADDTVVVEVLKKSGGKHCIRVTQVDPPEGKKAIVEDWIQKDVVFATRGEKKSA